MALAGVRPQSSPPVNYSLDVPRVSVVVTVLTCFQLEQQEVGLEDRYLGPGEDADCSAELNFKRPTRTFGSGYPTNSGRGVLGKPFPFVFWPFVRWLSPSTHFLIIYAGSASELGLGLGPARTYIRTLRLAFPLGSSYALTLSAQYGHSDNSSRPGGVMTTANFQSNGPNGTVFRILADLTTVTDLISDIFANCSGSLSNSSISAGGSPSPYNDSSTLPPQPEQIVQYYRASSIAVRFFLVLCTVISTLNTSAFTRRI
jgi:hypothetical protein